MSVEGYEARRNEIRAKLLEAMLQGVIPEIKPQLNLQSEMGFSFPTVSQLLNISDKEIMAMLESLADEGILEKKFFDKFLHCPQCRSMNLTPVYCCVKCGAGNVVRGRMLEHLFCKYADIEDEFLLRGKLVCPNCKEELHTAGGDYRSLGVLYKCRDCGEVFHQPAIKWRCLNCSSVTLADKIIEANTYSYSLKEAKRNWLQFELRPKSQLIQFLQGHGYDVEEKAAVKGRSGAEHTFAMLATRDDGVVSHRVAIGLEVSSQPVGLEKVFDFDDKAYDCGIYHKVLIATPQLAPEAGHFAARQGIKVLESADLEAFSASSVFPQSSRQIEAEAEKEPFHLKKGAFQFKSRSELINYLQSRGYEIKQDALVEGRSGAKHSIDLLAARDDGIVAHNIAIGLEVSSQPVGLEKVFDFDDKAYDCGIRDKVLIAVPGLSKEASRFAQRQRINVFEAEALEPPE